MTRCALCGEDAPEDVGPAPKGMVWLCPPCEMEMDVALDTLPEMKELKK